MSVGSTQAQGFAERFFSVRLPRHIADNVEKFAAQQGTVAFHVRGKGRWTVRMGNLEEPVVPGLADDAELTLWFSPDAFEGFVKGSLDVAGSLERNEIAFDGDAALLERFGLLLTPATTALGTRFNR
jgi:hypothetical protein